MTKADIIERISEKLRFSKKESAEMFEQVLDILKSTSQKGENIKISGFGNFEVREKANRKGRNPQSGETITIAARRVLTFKPSLTLRSRINGGTE